MKISIVQYQQYWTEKFAAEETFIRRALTVFDPAVEHIGSTSVEELGAKPIIDILVGIHNVSRLNNTIQPMIEAGYIYVKKYTPLWPGRRFYVKPEDSKASIPFIINTDDDCVIGKDFISTVHVHLIEKNTSDWIRHIAFRNYLRTHTDARNEYDVLKKDLSLLEFKDMNEYNDAKDSFIKKTEKLAVEWYQQQNQ